MKKTHLTATYEELKEYLLDVVGLKDEDIEDYRLEELQEMIEIYQKEQDFYDYINFVDPY